MAPDLPYSEACERNRGPILDVLRRHFADRRRVLEVGSGTGQHAVAFASALPHLGWQTSDLVEHHPVIAARVARAALPNLLPPLALDARDARWDAGPFDAVFSANTLHIMDWDAVQGLFARLPEVTTSDAMLVVYGPFNRGGRFTSESNAAFDAMLRERDAASGIRDIEAVDVLAAGAGFRLLEDAAMPANNRCMAWRREAGATG